MTKGPARASDHDRRVHARQVAALESQPNDDEGTPVWRAAAIERINHDRARHGIDELDTEPELHRLARDLGLLRRVP